MAIVVDKPVRVDCSVVISNRFLRGSRPGVSRSMFHCAHAIWSLQWFYYIYRVGQIEQGQLYIWLMLTDFHNLCIVLIVHKRYMHLLLHKTLSYAEIARVTFTNRFRCNNTKTAITLRRSRSFKVADFDTNCKPVCDFLLVNNTNLHHISYRFREVQPVKLSLLT